MKDFNPQAGITPRILATDLDGTLIPLPGCESNESSLKEIKALRESQNFGLIYATGRHFESVVAAMHEHQLPVPDWIVCDVGTAILKRYGDEFETFEPYESHLFERTDGINRDAIEQVLEGIGGLELQPPDHQQRFKISYQSSSESLKQLVHRINARITEVGFPYNCTGSIDPFKHCGLLDVLPRDVSKAYALIWLSTHADFAPDEVIYSGDSGNDFPALISGFRAIVVANGSTGLAEKVQATLQERNQEERFYLSSSKATSGVLEGCRHFGLIRD